LLPRRLNEEKAARVSRADWWGEEIPAARCHALPGVQTCVACNGSRSRLVLEAALSAFADSRGEADVS